ncbi:MAG: 30S ribosomal protein S9, partial [Planctomycetales bacterium]|nr:30S ribosomal protein S9 [Planctomycetales bacterium]
MATAVEEALGTGRRKTSVARVRVKAGTGKVVVNKRELNEFFRIEHDRRAVLQVLEACEVADSVDVAIRVHGGGTTGQAGACRQGIARALLKHDSDLADKLREGHFLTRDSRMKERKKP